MGPKKVATVLLFLSAFRYSIVIDFTLTHVLLNIAFIARASYINLDKDTCNDVNLNIFA